MPIRGPDCVPFDNTNMFREHGECSCRRLKALARSCAEGRIKVMLWCCRERFRLSGK